MISLIAAASQNNVIGKDNSLPWSLPADLKHFREVTSGHPVIMGRKTFESIGRPLPKRRNIIITRNADYAADGIETVSSLEEALSLFSGETSGEVFVIGGGEIFRQAISVADRIYLTRVEAEIEGDSLFPKIDPGEWNEASRREGQVDAENAIPHAFLVFERIKLSE